MSIVDLPGAVDRIGEWVRNKPATEYVCVTGVHGVMESQRDPTLRDVHNLSGLTVPDGMPLVWAGKYAGARSIERVYGPDLMLRVLAVAEACGWSSYFYGAAPGTAEFLIGKLLARYPGLKVAGLESPPFRPLTARERTETIARIDRSRADLVWVGLSTPKQERWMYDMAPHLRPTVLLGVGAAFDIHAGLLPQAPAWMQRSGLEWLYRLRQEPRRLWRRYLFNNPLFIIRVALQPPARMADTQGK